MQLDIAGDPLHTRCLTIALKQVEGDAIGFRADIIDLRKGGLMELAGRVATAGIIHKMELHGQFDPEDGVIQEIDWAQSHVMHEANRETRGECCRDPMGRLKELVGTQLGGGFASDLKQRFGGPLGCTHVSTLFQEVSAFVECSRMLRAEEPELQSAREVGERVGMRSIYFDAFLPEGEDASGGDPLTTLSIRLSDVFYAATNESGEERLFSHDEFRLAAGVGLGTWQIRDVRAGERRRRGPEFGAAPWHSWTDAMTDLAGRSLGGGMARFCLDRFGKRPEDVRARSAVLTLAPGMTQVGAALSDSLVPTSTARAEGHPLSGPGPCYMLRAEGPLMESIISGGSKGSSS